jgi:hypothetical protein
MTGSAAHVILLRNGVLPNDYTEHLGMVSDEHALHE